MRYAAPARAASNASVVQGPASFRSAGPLRGGQSSTSGRVGSVGSPLEPETRRYFESRFGHDFSKVRVHADSAAATSARSVAAQAYTVGHEITFDTGMFNPKSPSGRKLLAHELTHVVQQENPDRRSAHESRHESEAANAGTQAARGERANVVLGAPVTMQRQGLPGAARQTDLAGSASPLMASASGSVTVDGFATGKSDVSAANEARLSMTAGTIMKLLKSYPASKIRVIGYTDAVGQEKDNRALGQSRADSVQAALVGLGIPEVAIRTESRGAGDLLIQSEKAEPRNRRVRVVFEPSRLLRGGMSQGLTLSSGIGQAGRTSDSGKAGGSGLGGKCLQNPAFCHFDDPGGPGLGKPGGPPSVFKPIPDNTPYHKMDRLSLNAPFLSHGRNPQEGGDMTQTWARAYWKYRNLGLSEDLAAKAANSELSSTAGQDLGRDNPNAADQLNSQMKQAYPNTTTVGPANVTLFKF